ncbi:MAG: DegQ family serine endoprotease [Alphaproteobacteria bacterium]
MNRFARPLFAVFLLAFAPQAHAVPDSFSPVVEPLLPAVVNISTTQKITQPQGIQFDFQGLSDDPQSQQFKELFKQFNQQFGGGNVSREVTSLGSGFVIDPSGYVVTNNHVVANAEDITVIFADDSHLPAKVVGYDPKTDLALLKVKADHPLAAVHFGDSDALKIGDWVIAVGNPFGLGGSVSAGIVSARSRNINAGPFDDFIQTDAAINRGNSGGPLFNVKGEVVGINAAIFSPTGSNVGIGFAVPSDLAKPIIDQLRSTGKIRRGWLGVKIQEVSDDVAGALGLSPARGALVLEVTGPATGSGIQQGDVITRFDGHDIKQMHTLPRMVADEKPGKRVEIVVWRKGKEIPYEVTIGELPVEKGKAAADSADNDEAPAPKSDLVLGMAVTPITPQLREQASLPRDAHGLLVTELDPEGAGARHGITPGDIILDVGGSPADSVRALTDGIAAAKKAGREFALLKVSRKKALLFVAVPTK